MKTTTKSSLIKVIQASLSIDLLRPKYRAEAAGKPIGYGHCYIAAEAAFHMLGGKAAGYTPYTARDEDGDTHWWVVNRKTGEVVDPTFPQYTPRELKILYRIGRPCGFLTTRPSKRAQVIIDRCGKI